MRILVALCLMVGVARAEAPAVIATKLIDAQLAAMKGAQTSLEKQFPDDTVIGATGGGTTIVKDGTNMITAGIADTMRGVIASTKVLSLTAGGDAKVVWFGGEVEIGVEEQTGPKNITKSKQLVRFTELAVAEGGKWKVIAAEFGRVGTPKRDENTQSSIQGATKRLTMTKFLVDPKQMAFQLPAKDDTVFVFGTDKGEKAVGAVAAKKLLESWKGLKLEIQGDVREIEGTGYGFVHANINWVKPGGPPYRMRALVIATAEKSQPWVFRAVQFAVP